jgi:antitoxin HicB
MIMNISGYDVIIEPLPEDEGGGFFATVPALPGCMSDGETVAEALANVEDAISCWTTEWQEMGRPLPVSNQHRAHA